MAAALEDKMTLTFRNEMNEMKNMMKALVPTPIPIKAVEERCTTCGSNHNGSSCPLTRGAYDYPVYHDNFQQFQQAAAVGGFVQGNSGNVNQTNQVNHRANLGLNQQAQAYQAPVAQVPVAYSKFEAYTKNDATLTNLQKNLNDFKREQNEFQNEQRNFQKAMMSFMQNSGIMGGSNHASTSGTLPSNTIPNPRNECKGITTRSGVVLDGPLPPMPPPYVNPDNEKAKETEVTKDKVQPESSQSTANVQPRVDHGKGKDKLKDNEKGMNEKEKDDEAFLKDLQGLNSRLRGKSSDKGLYGMDISRLFQTLSLRKKDDFPSRNDESILKEEVHKETLKSYLNPLFEDDEKIISIEVSRQIFPKDNSEPSKEFVLDDMSSSPKEKDEDSNAIFTSSEVVKCDFLTNGDPITPPFTISTKEDLTNEKVEKHET
ncbi:hypothetical protein Tco_1243025 [Tanacetum coccineum]